MPHIHEFYDFVVSVFIIYKNKILLVYHKKYQEWLPIGGHIELDEDPEQALYREIQEECGLKVKILAETPPIRHRGVKPIPTPSYVDTHDIDKKHKHIAFVYFGVSKSDRVKLHTREHAEFRWVAKEELKSPRLKLVPSIYFYCLKALEAAKRHPQNLLSGIKLCLIPAFAGMTLSVMFLTSAICAEIQYAKVLDTAGTVEVLALPNQQWAPLQKKSFLKKGTSVRTRANSRVWMTLDPQLETLIELGENSLLNIWTQPPSRVSLKTGRLYVFRESEPAQTPFKILTPQILINIPSGGLMLDVSKKGSSLNVFAEDAWVTIFSKSRSAAAPQKIEEGHKFFKKTSGAESSYQRMRYADYAPWKVWAEKMYELKDDFAADLLEKELGQ